MLTALLPLVALACVLGVSFEQEAQGVRPLGDQEPPPAAERGELPLRRYVPGSAVRIDIGRGPRAAVVFSPVRRRPASPVVIFLHGWAAVDPRRYGPWIDHLTRRGTTVVYPVYHVRPFNRTTSLLPDLLEAVRSALARSPAPPGRLIVAGHSAGGGLAADFAATAAAAGLPIPSAAMIMYPARHIKNMRELIPSADLDAIPPSTRVLVLFGERDAAVGDRAARQIARDASRARLTVREVTDDAIDDHSAPRRSDGPTRRTFWRWLDRLVERTARVETDE